MKVGDKVEVILSKDWVMVLHINIGNRITCRTKDCREITFYDFELTDIKQ